MENTACIFVDAQHDNFKRIQLIECYETINITFILLQGSSNVEMFSY